MHVGNGDNSKTVKKLTGVLHIFESLFPVSSLDVRLICYISGAASQSVGCTDSNDSLVSRLRIDPRKDRDFVPLPGPLLRKYIAYARTYVFPR